MMNKKFTLLVALGILCLGNLTVNAQKIKGDFDEQTVWDKRKGGVAVDGWQASNVTQMFIKFPAVFEGDNRTSSPGKSVRMVNPFCGIGALGANAPAYITLGQTWVFADVSGMPGGNDQSDGGTIGGIQFTERPDSLVGYYKRTIGNEGAEDARVIAYLWKGTFKSLRISDATPSYTLVDNQDLCILKEKATAEGSTGKTIATLDHPITTVLNEWSYISIPFNYVGDEVPEMANIIISSANYYSRKDIKKENTLFTDDVKFVYNSKLSSITIDGKEIEGFDEDKFSYALLPSLASKSMGATACGKNAKVDIGTLTDSKIVITVTDETSMGEKQRTYTLDFSAEKPVITAPASLAGKYGEVLESGFTSTNTDAGVKYSYTFDTEGVAETTEDGKIRLIGAGTTTVTAHLPQSENFVESSSTPVTLTVEKVDLKVIVAAYDRERGANPNPKITYEGFVNGDTDAVFITKPKFSAPKPVNTEKVGDVQELTRDTEGEAANYNLIYEVGRVTIKRKTLIVQIPANRMFSIVGQELKFPDLIYTGFSFDENDSVFGDEKPTIAAPEADINVCGDYDVVISGPTELDNYVMTYNKASLLIRKTTTITLTGSVTKATYGDEPIQFTATTTNGLTITIKLKTGSSYASIDGVGLVTIKKPGTVKVAASTPQTEEYMAGEAVVELVIEKAPLTVTAKDVALPFDSIAPKSYELEYNGFVLNDRTSVFTALPTATCEISNPVLGATFPIVVAAGTGAANYAVTLVDGKLTIVNPTSVDTETLSTFSVYSNNGKVYVEGNSEALPIHIYNMQGALVKQWDNQTSVEVELNKKSVYIVKIGSETKRVLNK